VEEIVKGESVIARQEYNLFGTDVNGTEGIYCETNERTGRALIYFPELGEYGELLEFERVNPGVVPERNEDFINRTSKLEFTVVRNFTGFGSTIGDRR
jgi:hypothetical protein